MVRQPHVIRKGKQNWKNFNQTLAKFGYFYAKFSKIVIKLHRSI